MKKATPKPERKPVPLPSSEELDRAWKVVDDWFLHYYQLLFFHEPKLTTPGGVGHPFNLRIHDVHRHCILVERQGWPEFNFFITSVTKDEDVLKYCALIEQALENKKGKIHPMACCSLATFRNCVCAYSFDCPIHGKRCIGTHD